MKGALYSGLLDKLYLYVFCDKYFVPFALYFRKITKKSKEYQRFCDPGSVFSGHVETLILKFSGIFWQGRKGGKGWGASIPPPPHFKMCCYCRRSKSNNKNMGKTNKSDVQEDEKSVEINIFSWVQLYHCHKKRL